jgi:hypothetical protein
MFGLPSLLLAYGLSALKRRSLHWTASLGWITLWVVPALVYQLVWMLSSTSFSPGPMAELLLVAAPIGLWVLLGGASVVFVFEATAHEITGHRSSTMMDNIHVYFAYTAIQTAVFVAILVCRSRRHADGRGSDVQRSDGSGEIRSRWRDPAALEKVRVVVGTQSGGAADNPSENRARNSLLCMTKLRQGDRSLAAW